MEWIIGAVVISPIVVLVALSATSKDGRLRQLFKIRKSARRITDQPAEPSKSDCQVCNCVLVMINQNNNKHVWVKEDAFWQGKGETRKALALLDGKNYLFAPAEAAEPPELTPLGVINVLFEKLDKLAHEKATEKLKDLIGQCVQDFVSCERESSWKEEIAKLEKKREDLEKSQRFENLVRLVFRAEMKHNYDGSTHHKFLNSYILLAHEASVIHSLLISFNSTKEIVLSWSELNEPQSFWDKFDKERISYRRDYRWSYTIFCNYQSNNPWDGYYNYRDCAESTTSWPVFYDCGKAYLLASKPIEVYEGEEAKEVVRGMIATEIKDSKSAVLLEQAKVV